MLNVLRKPQESDNLAAGISSMSFLGDGVKTPPRPQQQDMAPPNPIPQQDIVVPAPPEPSELTSSADVQPVPRAMPSVFPRGNVGNSTIQEKAKGWSLSTTPLFGVVRGQPTNNLQGEATSQPVLPSVPAGRNPMAMNDESPLAMSDNVLFGSAGDNVAKAARGWSPNNTPIFAAVQNQPIARRSRITNKIGRVANRNGAVIGVSKMRLF